MDFLHASNHANFSWLMYCGKSCLVFAQLVWNIACFSLEDTRESMHKGITGRLLYICVGTSRTCCHEGCVVYYSYQFTHNVHITVFSGIANPLIFFLTLFQTCAIHPLSLGIWDRPEHFLSSLTLVHHFFLRHSICPFS